MQYITLDTCVWLKLLYIDFKNEDNIFDEICYWIENKHLTHIVPTNIIDEWNRHKLEYQNNIVTFFEKRERDDLYFLKHNSELRTTYTSNNIRNDVKNRIDRVDAIFSYHSLKAEYNDTLLLSSAKRNLNLVAPNHNGDSFRDTVNILSLLNYLSENKHLNSIFVTENYKDFSDVNGKRFDLHKGLESDFNAVKLSYEYIGDKEEFGSKLFNRLRNELAEHNFQDYLKEKRSIEDAKKLAERKPTIYTSISNPDSDYLENIKYIDSIILKSNPTTFEQEILNSLINRHDSYKQYFFNNIGNNGLV